MVFLNKKELDKMVFYIFKIRTLDEKETTTFNKYAIFLRRNKLD
jgi:hypothetical protein